MLNKGDKLYCKKTLNHFDLVFFYEGKIYTVINILNNDIRISDEVSSMSFFDISQSSLDEYRFEDYFMTNKEYRKLKLDKINESNLH